MKEAKFIQIKNSFSMLCKVEINIQAKAGVIWSLLTDAEGFPRWNSTVSHIDGQIREGERINIHVPGTKRTFKPTVSDVVENEYMMWSDGVALIFKGSRAFQLKPCDNGSTDFIMEERFQGLVFAMVKRLLPDFRLIFERYANDLKLEAERVASPTHNLDYTIAPESAEIAFNN